MAPGHADRFVTPDGHYLLSHSIGLAPRRAREAASAGFFDAWEHDPKNAWPQWLAAIERFRAALARLYGTDASGFCPQANLSSALTKVLHSLPLEKNRPTIVMSEDDFPSIGFVAIRAAEAGYATRLIARDRDLTDLATWDEALAGDVAFALVTHVQSNNGVRVPVADVCRLARERGIRSVVDVAQSAGVIPIAIGDWQPDFVIGSSVKWLCGGPGAGYLWVSPALVGECRPVDVGWFSHEDPFEFDIRDFRYAADALRFFGGTPSVAPYVVATAGIETIAEIGVDAIRRHNLALCARLVDALDERELACPRDDAKRGGTVVVDLGERRQRFTDALRAAGVAHDARSEGVRLSPHVYNDESDVDAVLDALTRARR